MNLSGKDKRILRSIGNRLKPLVMIGKEGLTDSVIKAIDEAHTSEELIKLKILEPKDHDRKQIASDVDARSKSQVVGMVGGSLLLFRRDPENPGIALPSDRASS